MKKKFFNYDAVLNVSHIKDLPSFYEYNSSLNNQKILAVTYDHRFFNLDSKNFIKNFVELNNLDHLMFTLKPSSSNIISKLNESIFNNFLYFSQLVFTIQSMIRYDIKKGFIDTSGLKINHKKLIFFNDIKTEIYNFIDILRNNLNLNLNEFNKAFTIFSTFKSIEKNFKNKTLYSIDSNKSDVMDYQKYFFQSITELEKNLFWVGFDPSYKSVPQDKPYPETKYTKLINKSSRNKGLFERKLRYCIRCCLPETMEGIDFDDLGICVPCRSSEEKMHINWEERIKNLQNLLNQHKSINYYDCMLPMSGGKDSTYQAYLLKDVFNVSPLAVTHGQNWMSLEGRYNLENCLQKFDMDHLFFYVNRNAVNIMAKKSIKAIGDVCWHCHIGAGTFPIQSALCWNIDLMIWGESIAERDGRSSYSKQKEASLFYNLEVSALVPASDLADHEISAKDMTGLFYPSIKELKNTSIRYLHLGNYIFWDEEKQVEFIKRNFEWMDSKVENTYKGYKSVECIMAGLHDYSNFIKRGIGRATIHASDDVRRGILTREEAFEIIKIYDTQRPHVLDYYLEITGISEKDFESTLIEARKKSKFANKLK